MKMKNELDYPQNYENKSWSPPRTTTYSYAITAPFLLLIATKMADDYGYDSFPDAGYNEEDDVDLSFEGSMSPDGHKFRYSHCLPSI